MSAPLRCEPLSGTNTTTNDTDADGIWDGIEDRNRDGRRASNETSAIEADTDRDGLCDGNCSGFGEDLDGDGVKDANEPNPLVADTDGDGIIDGVEFLLMLDHDDGWTVTHDFDGDALSDLNDRDADDDGLEDGIEDHNRDASYDSAKESDAYDNDTDGDGLYDGPEPSPYEDTDNDTAINVQDTNSNGDLYTDDEQVWAVFCTNALDGAYGADTWIALNAPSTNPYYPDGHTSPDAEAYDFTASVALYTWDSTTSAGQGTQIRNPYGLGPGDYRTIVDLRTPEGYPVWFDESVSPHAVYIQVSASHFGAHTKAADELGEYSGSVRAGVRLDQFPY